MTLENLVLCWNDKPDDLSMEWESSDEPGYPVYLYAHEEGEVVEATLSTGEVIAIRDWLTARLDLLLTA